MKKYKNSMRASALQITFISVLAVLLTLGGAPQRLRLVMAEGLHYPVVIDPSWTPTGDMGIARQYHTATLLPSGKVLVAGGGNNSDLRSAELYDPTSGISSTTGGLNTACERHTATLTTGKVLREE